MTRWRPLALFGIAFLGLALRLYGLDWDQIQARYQLLLRLYGSDAAQGNNFHPDERQILFHVVQLSWPSSWAQFFLKWILAQPAVTCVIPGTRNAKHVADNLAAATGPLPDEAMRRRMAEHFNSL